ncbi:phage major capsid protein [Microbispora bryophytorum]|uniref:phage major capsid protein n=1 Tax=Microbispora bryophytorum TaxID=1460882 RepID=UPI0033FED18E
MDEILRRLGEIETEMRALHEAAGDEPFNDEQQTRWNELEEQRTEQLRLQEEERARQADLERRRGTVAQFAARGATEPGDGNVDPRGPRSPEFMQRVDPWDGSELRALSRAQVRDRSLKVLEAKDSTRHLRSDQVDKVDRLLRARTDNCDGGVIGRRLLATETDAYRSAFMKASLHAQPAFTEEEARAIEEFRAMAGGTDAAGGYGIPVLIDPTIILTAQGSLNPFRRISRQVTITTDAWKGVSSAGVTWSYDAEGSTVSDDSPTLAQPSVPIVTARGFIPYSIEVGMDYPGFADEMSTLLMEGYDELQAKSFAVGSGSNEPTGILTALDANTNVEVVVTTDGAFGGVDINKVWGALPDRWKQNATWVMNHDVGNEVATFGNGNNLSFMTVDLTGVVETIRQRPVEFASYFPDFTGTTGASNILAVGDFRNFLIADRAGMSLELVPHLFDVTNNRPTGQRGWFAWARHGANSINDLGFRLLQNQT